MFINNYLIPQMCVVLISFIFLFCVALYVNTILIV